MSRKNRWFLPVVSLVACGAVVGCGAPSGDGEASGEAVVQPPENVRYSAVWHNGPHLDLMSPLGSFVRAYVEDAAWAFGSWDADELSRPVVEASAFDVEEALEEVALSDPTPEFQGAQDFHVAEVSGPPERTRVTVCRTTPRLGSRDLGSNDGFVTRAEGEPPSVIPSVLVVSQEGQAPPAGMTGERNVPPAEAFGEWRVLRFVYLLLDEEWAVAQSQCNALLGLPPEYPDSPAEETRVPSLPEVSPSPGWPVGADPVAGVE